MLVSEFHGENAIAKIVPVDDDLASADASDDPDQGECRDARWILTS